MELIFQMVFDRSGCGGGGIYVYVCAISLMIYFISIIEYFSSPIQYCKCADSTYISTDIGFFLFLSSLKLSCAFFIFIGANYPYSHKIIY